MLLLCGMSAAMAQRDSIDMILPSEESLAAVDMETIADISFPTELAIDETDIANIDRDNRVLASVLAIVLGDFGIHHFYTGDIQHGILHAVFFWTGIPAIIGIIEGVMWLTDPSGRRNSRMVVSA